MIYIIGAGPAGNFLAYDLAKNNQEITVFEEHGEIGKPVQCTGLVTHHIKEALEPLNFEKIKKEFLLNTIKKTRVFSPNNKYTEIDLKDNYIIDRTKFDSYLADKAKEEGAEYCLEHSFSGYDNKSNSLIFESRNRIKKIKLEKGDFVVGSDGPLSKTAKSFGMYNHETRKFFHGIQVLMKIKNNNIIEFYPYIKDLGWLVPEDENAARVGIIARKDANQVFKNFIKKFKGKIIEKQAGLVPIYNNKQIAQKNNVFLLGDAAGMVKATTGGGIIEGLVAGKVLSESIIKEKIYEREWKKRIGTELQIHLMMRKMLDSFSDEDWNNLIRLTNQDKIKKVLKGYDREYPIWLAIELLKTEPRYFGYIKYASKIFIN
jgi:digeranylgeranylglycerophospholipid reductase